MLFSSITFMFTFLPCVILVYYISPKRIRNFILMLFSMIFYAWGEPKYIFVMLASILVGYGMGLLTDYYIDFLKIRNIVLGYDFPQQWIKHLGINRLSLRFQIDNPKYLWVANDVNVDPETLGLRNQSSYIFGLNVNF